MTSVPWKALLLSALVGGAQAPTAALAHHSFAMYDSAKLVTLKGTVKSFEWTNPHAILWVTTGPVAGQAPELWSVELSTSPGNLTRMGWSKRSLNPGDRVAVDINPLRSGQKGGSLKKVVLVDTGQVLTTTPLTSASAARP